MPDDMPSRITDSIQLTQEDGLVTNVERLINGKWQSIGGGSGNDNDAAVRLLSRGEKIDLGDVTGVDKETLQPEAFREYVANDICTWNLVIPEGTTEIAENAFCEGSGGSGSGGVGLLCTALNLPDGLVSIGDGAFQNLIEITDLIIPNSVQHVGSSAFCGCALLENVTYPMDAEYGDSVFNGTAIPDMLYSNTSILYVPDDVSGDIVIPEGVTTIPSEIFENKTGITSISIPASVTSIGEGAFNHIINCTSIISESSAELPKVFGYNGSSPYCDVAFVLKANQVITLTTTEGWDSNINSIIVPDDLVDSYKSATNWSSIAYKIKGLNSVELNTDSMISIGAKSYTVKVESFGGTPQLTSVTCDSQYITNITLNGDEFTCDVTGGDKHTATFTVAYTINGTSYTQAIEMEVYVAANALEYVDNAAHAALVDVNSNIYLNVDEWHAASDPTLVGILVSDGIHRYVIGKDYIPSVAYDGGGSPYEYWGGYQIEIDSDHYFNDELRITDFDGKGNTRRIVAALNETNHDGYFNVEPYSAAGLCNNYTFANGLKGYMWSSGEENIAVQNKDLIKELLTAIGGTALNAFNDYIWSSTQSSSDFA